MMKTAPARLTCVAAALLLAIVAPARGEDEPEDQVLAAAPARTDTVIVRGRADSLVGQADTASQGSVGWEQLEQRPLARPGEVLETVPGLIATQHSGAGKANQ